MKENDFFDWLTEWEQNLHTVTFTKLQKNPKKIAVICVDMVVGFCHKGSLASPEVKSIIPNVVNVFEDAHKFGVEKYLLVQDAHHHEATEFAAYPPHCVKGSDEAEAIPELKALLFAKEFTTIEKNSLSAAYLTKFDSILAKQPQIDTFIIVGDCTDLCVYNMAMHLRLSANAANKKVKVVVPANAVATYDLSVEKAKEIGAFPHPEKLLHPLFLYHMALNAVKIYKEVH
jgi:nicotinamidase-related amidase